MKKPVLLMILDGFGIREQKEYNGILNAPMSTYFSLWKTFPHTELHASGPLVGLPDGQIGSSEVGHLTMGAGRLIKQPFVRITEDIDSGRFFDHPNLIGGIHHIQETGGNMHIMGLLGPGGVHSSSKHLYAFLEFYDKHLHEVNGHVYIHSFLDGRDTPQRSALEYIKDLDSKIQTLQNKDRFHIATLCGRYYAMDRDKRWDRTQQAYDLLVNLKGKICTSYEQAISESYEEEVYDEFIKPVLLDSVPIQNDDFCVFYNFRSDRPRQLLSAFVDKTFDAFEVKQFSTLRFKTLTEYSPAFDVDVLYPTIYPKEVLGQIISENGKKQLRISESEKFPHVTYFFNGLENAPFEGEDRVKVDSPKVATYDLKPEMSCKEVTDILVDKIHSQAYDLIVLNYANPDMVGHTGSYEAVINALKSVDEGIKRVKNALDDVGGLLIITADHGNCESMRDEKGLPHTKHTYNRVPFVLCNEYYTLRQDVEKLSLYNIAPTLLELLEIQKPEQMTGTSLIITKPKD